MIRREETSLLLCVCLCVSEYGAYVCVLCICVLCAYVYIVCMCMGGGSLCVVGLVL